jgi:capsular polysaccharide biosynthesis protein
MMEEQPLDLRSSFRAVRRHRLLVAVLAAVGLAAAIAYGVKTPPLPEARSLVLLPPSAITGNPGPSPYTQTQEIIVSSTRVLSSAGASVYPPVGEATLREELTVTAPSQDVLQIAVHAPTQQQAEHLADAVAASYISYVAGTANGSEQLLAQLHHEADQLTNKILGLQREINAVQSRLAGENANSAVGRRDSNLLNSLSTEQEQLSIQLNNVNTQVVSAEVTTAQATSATQLLQRAEPVASSKARLPLIALLGALAGLIAGCVVAVGLAKGDRRLRSRDAIAAAMGVPVVASMWARRCKKVGDWKRLLERAKSPSPVEAWNARRVFRRLVVPIGAPDIPEIIEVRLLAFSGDEAAAAAGIKMVGAAATLGMSSLLEIEDTHSVLAPLRAACAVAQGGAASGTAVELKAVSTTTSELAGLVATVRLEAVDPGRPKVNISSGTTLLLVSSGFATSAELARAALAVSDAGSPIAGVVVANPDPDDHTTGLLPDAGEPLGRMPRSLNGHVAAELARRESS